MLEVRFIHKSISVWAILFMSGLVFFLSCSLDKTPPKVGFYYWKTHFELSSTEEAMLDSLNAESLYLRIFDVDWDFNTNQAIPKGTQSNQPIFPKGATPVPTIYITNRTFTHISDVDSLAQKILDYTQKIVKTWKVSPKKLQLDVDWTATTKDKYFQLLQYIKSSGHFDTISSTIRLHQYKYPKKTGVPPVDEGVLMCYNTGKIKDWQTENSIATLNDIKIYTNKSQRYALPLGIALPIFSWTVIFRDSNFYKIVSDADLSWQEDAIHFRQLTANRYVVKEATFFKGHYLYEGDLLRYEAIKADELLGMASHLSAKQDYSEILFYHLADDNFARYTVEELRKVIQAID